VFDIGTIDEGDFYVKFRLMNKSDGFLWVLVATYGAAQAEHKEAYRTELVQTCAKEVDPILVGGDFNIIRDPFDKNNSIYEDRWPFLFNAIIDSLDLRELELSNRKFTWANSREIPTYERLDQILVSTEWESKFPLAMVQALTREISDHTPLVLDIGNGTIGNKQSGFKFELG
jgi:exonuclease III